MLSFFKKKRRLATHTVAPSRNYIERQLLNHIRQYFFDFKVKQFMMTATAIHREYFDNRYHLDIIFLCLQEKLRVPRYHAIDDDGNARHANIKFTFYKRQQIPGSAHWRPVEVADSGRPFVFKMEDFLTPAECARVMSVSEDSAC